MATTYSVDGQSFGSIDEVENYLSDQGYSGKYTIEDRRQGGIGTQSGVGMGEGAGLLGVAGGGGRGYTSFGDMFDGGGPGRSGPTFVGGPFSAGLNAMGVRPAGYAERMAAGAASGPQGQRGFGGYGYTDPATGQWVSAGRDMIDGGGPGRSGDTFQGGPFSGLLNALGVRPAGYRARQEAAERAGMQMTPADVRTGLLGGTGGTAEAVDAALAAAGAKKKSTAPAGQYRLSYSDVRDLSRRTGGEYPSAVGDIATADELAFLMGEGRNYFMSDEGLAMAAPGIYSAGNGLGREPSRPNAPIPYYPITTMMTPRPYPLTTRPEAAREPDGFTKYMAGMGYDQDFVNALKGFPSQRARFMQQYSRSIPGISSGGLLGSGMSTITTFE